MDWVTFVLGFVVGVVYCAAWWGFTEWRRGQK